MSSVEAVSNAARLFLQHHAEQSAAHDMAEQRITSALRATRDVHLLCRQTCSDIGRRHGEVDTALQKGSSHDEELDVLAARLAALKTSATGVESRSEAQTTAITSLSSELAGLAPALAQLLKAGRERQLAVAAANSCMAARKKLDDARAQAASADTLRATLPVVTARLGTVRENTVSLRVRSHDSNERAREAAAAIVCREAETARHNVACESLRAAYAASIDRVASASRCRMDAATRAEDAEKALERSTAEHALVARGLERAKVAAADEAKHWGATMQHHYDAAVAAAAKLRSAEGARSAADHDADVAKRAAHAAESQLEELRSRCVANRTEHNEAVSWARAVLDACCDQSVSIRVQDARALRAIAEHRVSDMRQRLTSLHAFVNGLEMLRCEEQLNRGSVHNMEAAARDCLAAGAVHSGQCAALFETEATARRRLLDACDTSHVALLEHHTRARISVVALQLHKEAVTQKKQPLSAADKPRPAARRVAQPRRLAPMTRLSHSDSSDSGWLFETKEGAYEQLHAPSPMSAGRLRHVTSDSPPPRPPMFHPGSMPARNARPLATAARIVPAEPTNRPQAQAHATVPSTRRRGKRAPAPDAFDIFVL